VPTRLPRRSKTATGAGAPACPALWRSGPWTPSRPPARSGCHRPDDARAGWRQRPPCASGAPWRWGALPARRRRRRFRRVAHAPGPPWAGCHRANPWRGVGSAAQRPTRSASAGGATPASLPQVRAKGGMARRPGRNGSERRRQTTTGPHRGASAVRGFRRRREAWPWHPRRAGPSSGASDSVGFTPQAPRRRPASRQRGRRARSTVALCCGGGAGGRQGSISCAPRAKEPDSCPPTGWRVVAHRTWGGVGGSIEGAPGAGHDGCAHCHHGIKGVSLARNRLRTG